MWCPNVGITRTHARRNARIAGRGYLEWTSEGELAKTTRRPDEVLAARRAHSAGDASYDDVRKLYNGMIDKKLRLCSEYGDCGVVFKLTRAAGGQ
jgi:hypothetical protein